MPFEALWAIDLNHCIEIGYDQKELNILILYNLLKFPIVLQHFNSFLILYRMNTIIA